MTILPNATFGLQVEAMAESKSKQSTRTITKTDLNNKSTIPEPRSQSHRKGEKLGTREKRTQAAIDMKEQMKRPGLLKT